MTSEPTCPNCPPGYDCETGNYSFDDFEEIRDEQAARRAAGTEEGRCDGHCSGQWVDPDCSWHGAPRREVTP